MLDTQFNPIILANGPPRAGKNFIEELLAPHLNIVQIALADAVKLATLFAFGIVGEADPQDVERALDDMESDKGRPRPVFNGLSWREALIRTAETYRLLYGADFWAHTAIRKVRQFDMMFSRMGGKRAIMLISDIGFPRDLGTFEDYFNKRSVLLRLHRQGTTFGKFAGYEEAYGAGTGIDSRNWVFANKIASADWTNDGDEKEARHDLIKILGETMGWPAINAVALERNDKAILAARMSKAFRVPQSNSIAPFVSPKMYWPDLTKFIGQDLSKLDVVNQEQAAR